MNEPLKISIFGLEIPLTEETEKTIQQEIRSAMIKALTDDEKVREQTISLMLSHKETIRKILTPIVRVILMDMDLTVSFDEERDD